MNVETDVVVVGAGPVGLFHVFELGLLGIRPCVVESLDEVGGQCAALYPEKRIYDIPAIPSCTARELIERLTEQLRPFSPNIRLGEQVVAVDTVENQRFEVRTDHGACLECRAVVIAGGLGSFRPRPLRLPGIDAYAGVNLAYQVTDRERFKGRRVVVLGGGDSALDWVLDLHDIAESVTLVHRREAFRAQPASVEHMRELCANEPVRLRCIIGRVCGFDVEAGRLSALDVTPLDGGEVLSVPLDELLVFYGLAPDLGPIASWGLELERNLIRVDSATLETSREGVFAVGDINSYPSKKKLILSGFHEAAMAAYAVQHLLNPQLKQRVLYTTTSSLMHDRLGVTD